MKYPDDFINKIICTDCQEGMRDIPDRSIDLMVTDPPYGYSFMGRDWDRALVNVDIWKECLRVLKPGAFAFIMCAPRQDVLSRQIINLEEAGFITGFTSLFHCYASGFPKAQNISKAIDKKECMEQLIRGSGRKPIHKEFKEAWNSFRGIIGRNANAYRPNNVEVHQRGQVGNLGLKAEGSGLITAPATPQAKALEGSYGGFQPKPAVEVILVVMKPLSEKTYVEQALKNSKGITWLDGGKIPYKGKRDEYHRNNKTQNHGIWDNCRGKLNRNSSPRGRFPANLLVSDDVLNDGKNSKGSHNQIFITEKTSKFGCSGSQIGFNNGYNDSGSFSRYFNLDKWWEEKIKQLPESVQKTFPFLIVPKASKSEKNRGCERLEERARANINKIMGEPGDFKTGSGNIRTVKFKNHHPTVKPIKLMSYLIILGSRPNDIILDPFVGSGTTCIAAKMLGRKYIGFDDDEGYIEIAQCRLRVIEAVLI